MSVLLESLVEGDQALTAGHLLGLGKLQRGDQFDHLFLRHGPLLWGRYDLFKADANVCRDGRKGRWLDLTSKGHAAGQRQRH